MLLLLLFHGAMAAAGIVPIVNTSDCGPVQGILTHSVESFIGIPYAHAPLRWAESRPLPSLGLCWHGTLLPKTPAKCVQMSSGEGSEDCLFLNIFTPNSTSNAESLPVMVYMHGGDLTEGAAPHTLSEGVSLFTIEGKPLILVAAQYRLNAFGFLSVPELYGADSQRHSSSTGMYGIRDQQQALAWVQRNIGRFNGDPSRVTVFGQSSGGTSVFSLMASPASKGLFSRAMSLSGSPNVTMDLPTQQRQHASVVTKLGCDQPGLDRLACLRNKTVSDIVAAIPRGADHANGTKAHPSWDMDNIFTIVSTRDGARQPGLAVADGDTVQVPLLQALKGEDGVDVPFIVSNMAQECGQRNPYSYQPKA